MAVGKIRKILHLVPDAVFRNYNDEVVEWLDARPRPTRAQIDAVTDQDVLNSELEAEADKTVIGSGRMDKLIFDNNFDRENRLRALEGRAAMNKQQYKEALVNQYKNIP
jgi:hypothetical protein